MPIYALAGRQHRVLCGRCRVRLGDLQPGPQSSFVAEPGGPPVEVVLVGANQYVLRLLEGYLQRKPDGVWVPRNHARKRLLRGLEPRFNQGRTRNGIVDYPARVECPRCSTVCTIDPSRLGYRILAGGVLAPA